MNLKPLSNNDLVDQAIAYSKNETRGITNATRHYCEIFIRKVHLERGFSSLHQMLVEVFNFDNTAAHRRVNAVLLAVDVPEILNKIDEGKTCMQVASDIQTFLNLKRGAKRPYSQDKIKALVERCYGLSTREVQIVLAELNPKIDFKHSKKMVSKDRVEIKYTCDIKTEAKLERIRELRSHTNPYITREELIDYMAELTLDKIDPERKAARAKAKAPTPAQESKSQPIKTHDEIVSEVGEIQIAITFDEERTRYISAETKRQVFKDNKGCVYIHKESGQRCGSKHQLQTDHITPYSHGGSNSEENLQPMCAKHNRYKWQKRAPAKIYSNNQIGLDHCMH